jgi:hypothetical protein
MPDRSDRTPSAAQRRLTVGFQTHLLIGFGVGLGVALGTWFGWLGYVIAGTYFALGCLLHWRLGWREEPRKMGAAGQKDDAYVA